MISISLGEKFCNWYNREFNVNLTPCEIFKTIIAPILFNDDKHLIIWINSKFSNPKIKDSFTDRLNSFCEEVESDKGGLMDSLKVFGGCATPYDTKSKKYKSKAQKTMFCYTENQYFTINERYYSWIGSAFLLGCEELGCEEFAIAVDDEDYVKIMFNSINDYRKALNDNYDIKGGQIYTWNTLYFYNYYNGSVDTIIEKYFDGKNGIKNDLGFEHIIFNIVKHLPNVKYINLESFGEKANITCGAIQLNIDYVKRISDLFEQIYKSVEGNDDFSKFDFNKYFGGKNVMYKAIENGCIYENFFDPLSDINFIMEKKTKKNNIFLKYIEIIMNAEQKTMVNDFANLINNLKKKGGKRDKNFYFELTPNVTKFKFINSINEIKKYDVDDVMTKMVEFATSSTTTPYDFKLMIAYLNFKIK